MTGRDHRVLVAVVAAAAVVALATGVGVFSVLGRDTDARAPSATGASPSAAAPRVASVPGQEPQPRSCTALGPFVPERLVVHGVLDAEVVPVPRDDRGVTGVLPLSDKHRFAWDMPPSVQPGERRGNVLLNTHTWADGSAAGNRLLDGLEVGTRIVLRGSGQRQCYRVTRRIEVAADEGYPPYYDDGPHRVAIVVCSGRRTGPGEWSHRTIWFARAVA